MTKLTHQPFSTWLLSDEPLTPEEMRQLQEHLRFCQECQQQQGAWLQVHRLFQDAGQVAPAQGFVARWQQRMITARHHKQRQIAWAWFGLCAGFSTLALFFLAYLAINSLQSPLSLVSLWVYRAVLAFSYWNSLAAYLGVIKGLVPGFSIIGIAFLAGFISFLSVLWLATYRQLSSARRVVR